MTPSKSFKDLIVWQKAHQFVVGVYKLTTRFPKEEIYGLTSQLRKAAVSTAGNIAEGYARRTKPDKIRFLNIAQGSLEEAKYYLLLGKDLNYGHDQSLVDLSEETSKLLNSYVKAIEEDAKKF
jgi:four helix bundle protein